jgi:hypothetical protein
MEDTMLTFVLLEIGIAILVAVVVAADMTSGERSHLGD